MADQMRWRYGDTNPVISKPIASATVIEVGDLVEMAAGGDVTPASLHAWNTDLATTQDEFQNAFLGVAMQRSRAGDVEPIRVATSGVFEFDCAAATFELGALAAGNEAKAIGRVAKRYGTSTTRALVEIFSTVMRGGPQPKA